MGENNNSRFDVGMGEVLLQAAVYCGAPAGMDAFRIAEESLAAQGVDVESIE